MHWKSDIYDENLLYLLQKPVYKGWLLPNGSLIIVKNFEHIKVAIKYFNELENIYDYLEKEQTENTEIVEDNNWHIIYYYQSEERRQLGSCIVNYIYDHGWGRIGVFQNYGLCYLELECKKEHKNVLEKYVKVISDLLNKELKITIVQNQDLKLTENLKSVVDSYYPCLLKTLGKEGESHHETT